MVLMIPCYSHENVIATEVELEPPFDLSLIIGFKKMIEINNTNHK